MRNLFIIIIIFTIPIGMQANNIDKGIELFDKEDYSGAKEVFELIIKDNPEHDVALSYLARVLLEDENYDDAIDHLEHAVELKEKNSNYHFWLAIAYGVKAQDVSVFKAARYAKKMKNELIIAIDLDSNNLDARFNLAMYYLNAPGIMGGSLEKAKQQATEIKKLDVLKGLSIYAEIYTYEENYDMAVREYLSAIEKYPENDELYWNLGLIYEDQKMEYSKALEMYENTVKLDTSYVYAYYRIGRMGALHNSNLDIAIICLEKYIQSELIDSNPPYASAHWRLGMVYENKGEKELARKEYEMALSLDPKHKEAKNALSNL